MRTIVLIIAVLTLMGCDNSEALRPKPDPDKLVEHECESRGLTEEQCATKRVKCGQLDLTEKQCAWVLKCETWGEHAESCKQRVIEPARERLIRRVKCPDNPECEIYTLRVDSGRMKIKEWRVSPYSIEEGIARFCRRAETNHIPSCIDNGGNVSCGKPFIAGSCPAKSSPHDQDEL